MSNENYKLEDFIQLDDPQTDSMKDLVKFYLQYRYYDRAISVLEMLLAMDYQDVATRLILAQTYLIIGTSWNGEEILEPLLNKDPAHPDALVLLARIYIAQGKHSEAARILNEVVDADPKGATRAGRRARTVAASVLDGKSTETRV
jgi:predicted Zn-dependent protease